MTDTNGVAGAPQWLGNALLVRKIGEGSMGEVWEARTPTGDKLVVKLIKEEAAKDPELARRFQREGGMLRRLCLPHVHPNIVVFHHDGHGYIVMDWIEGMTLADRLSNIKRPLTTEEICEITRQICEGLERVHAHKITHRDLKPANIMLAAGMEMQLGWVRLIDFGVAKDHDPEADELTQPGKAMGTPRYMAPEQLGGDPEKQVPANARTDLFAVGWILQVMLLGKDPLEGLSLIELYRRKPAFEMAEKAPKGIDKDLWKVARACTMLDPSARPKSAEEVRRRLEDVAARKLPAFVSRKIEAKPEEASGIQPTAHPGAKTVEMKAVAPPKKWGPRAIAGGLVAVAAAILFLVIEPPNRSHTTPPMVPAPSSVAITVPVAPTPPLPEPTQPRRRPTRVARATPRPAPPPPPPPTVREAPTPPPRPTPRPVATHPTPLPTIVGATTIRQRSGRIVYQIPPEDEWDTQRVLAHRDEMCTGLRLQSAWGETFERFCNRPHFYGQRP